MNDLHSPISPNTDLMWPEAGVRLEVNQINNFLIWAAEQNASDIKIQGSEPVRIYVDGLARAVTPYKVENDSADRILTRLYGESGKGLLANKQAIDFSHEIKIDRLKNIRFRVCVAPVTAHGVRTHQTTLRIIPNSAPTFDDLGTEDSIQKAWLAKKGLSFITGETGSGKSTLMAAGTKALLMNGCGEIQSFENPIEFVFNDITCEDSWISQTEIPTQLGSFSEALIVSMRRYPKVIIVGECRDPETIEAAINASQQGSAVYTTSHARTVIATLDRLGNVFPENERDSRSIDVLELLNIVVSQRLELNPQGGRTALKEWLVFDSALVDELIPMGRKQRRPILTDAFSSLGQTMEASALQAYDEGKIYKNTLLSILPAQPFQVVVPSQGMGTPSEVGS